MQNPLFAAAQTIEIPNVGPWPMAHRLCVVRDPAAPYGTEAKITDARSVHRMAKPHMAGRHTECFIALALNVKNKLIGSFVISEGDLNNSIVHPREVFAPLVVMSAAQVIFLHNHPSGDPAPSRADMATTKRLKEVGEMLGIKVLDHVITAGEEFYSFQEHGQL